MLSFTTAVLSFSAPSAMLTTPMARSAAPAMGLDTMVGVSEETGGKVWDPLGLAENADDENLNLLRAAELKHGRVAMLACVGWIWTATGTHFSGMLSPSTGISFDQLGALDPLSA